MRSAHLLTVAKKSEEEKKRRKKNITIKHIIKIHSFEKTNTQTRKDDKVVGIQAF